MIQKRIDDVQIKRENMLVKQMDQIMEEFAEYNSESSIEDIDENELLTILSETHGNFFSRQQLVKKWQKQ